MEKAADIHDENKAAHSIVERVAPKIEQARVATEEEHNLSVWDAISKNKDVVFWCVFFAFSAVGWYVTFTHMVNYRQLTDFSQGALMHRLMVL